MAYRLGDFVVYGELRNVDHYSTHGLLALRGEADVSETVLRFDLTGNCDKDLLGKRIRFWPHKDYPETAVFLPDEHKGLQMRQIGPTGSMTADGWVRMLPCSIDEFLNRSALGEPPPTTWVRRLYLEWYSQNGRVVAEIPGAYIEECIDDGNEGSWRELPNLSVMPAAEDPARSTGIGVTLIRSNDTGDVDQHNFTVEDWSPEPFDSDDLEDPVAELELMDRCIDEGRGKPVIELLSDLDKWPRPDTVSDTMAEGLLKGLLGQMAMLGIALDVCEHFTPRDCYALLLETILPEEESYEELIGTGWVQHFSTWEYCTECEQRMQQEFDDRPLRGPSGPA